MRFRHLSVAISSFFAGNLFFYLAVGLFTLSSIWVATASLYPMAFDEDFHMGMIEVFSRGLIPYGIEHTREMAFLGAATADASYLFHYLLSFPYRILASLGIPFDIIVVILRLMNIAMVVVGLFIFRTALREASVSPAVANFSIALFTLIPIFPPLAGQVNYDNLLLLIVAFAFLYTIRISRSLLQQGKLPVKDTWLLIITVLFGMPTKYAFLPLAASLAIWIMLILLKNWKKHRPTTVLSSFFYDSNQLPRQKKVILGSFVAVGIFFSFHYVTNYVQYGNPIPSCHQVFDEEACMANGPWRRNFNLKLSLDPNFQAASFGEYAVRDWFPGMAQRLTFAVAGPTNTYQTKKPLPIFQITLSVLTVIGTLCLLVAAWSMRRYRILLGLTLLATALYVLPLLWRLYQSYVTHGQAVAVNGRYLLPLLPFVTATLIIAMQQTAQRIGARGVLPLLSVVTLVFLLLTGGGVATYAIQAESHWFWSGWGQWSHQTLQSFYSWVTLR